MQTANCNSPLHPKAMEGLRLFNNGKYFEAHEELEAAWNDEKGPVHELYRGILQVAVTYLHLTRGNYVGAQKVYGRSLKWLKDWPDRCQGVNVRKLRKDARNAIESINPDSQFDLSLLKPVEWSEQTKRIYFCDRCGIEMIERNCKVTCPNCGNRFDCSDLNIYLD